MPQHIYVCITEDDEPDNMAMAQYAEVVLLVRALGDVVVWKARQPEDIVIDVSMPARDWSYTVVPT